MKNLINSFLIFTPALISAQDLLYKADNSKLQVKVSEISTTTVKYKLFNNPNGPLYVIKKSDVALIIYQNGLHETFKSQAKEETGAYYSAITKDTLKEYIRKQKFKNVTQNQNAILINAVEFLNSGIGVSYLREIWDNRITVHVPFAASYSKPGMDNALTQLSSYSANYQIAQTKYDIGLGLYFNTSGKRAITHFVGPLIRNAQYSGTYEHYSFDTYNYTHSQKTFQMNETSFMINNGLLCRFTPNFNMMVNFAVGKFIGRTVSGTPDNDPSGYNRELSRTVALHAGLHFGYRF